jgi:hypothetical protein
MLLDAKPDTTVPKLSYLNRERRRKKPSTS